MLTFVVFDADGVDSGHFPPRHAYLIGPDEIPMQGSISLSPGLVECEKNQPQTAALAVQMNVARADAPDTPLGLLTIQTCLLPDHPEPYLLNIELARHRIMLFLNKLEDWGMTDLSPETQTMRWFEEARSTFTTALVAQRDAPPDAKAPHGFNEDADRRAARSVSLATEAGEGLALANAERQWKLRSSGTGYQEALAHAKRLTQEQPAPGSAVLVPGAGHVVLPGPAQIGCSISPQTFTEAQQRAVTASCDFITMPMRWVDMEPTEGKYNFAQTDRWIEWAVRAAKLPIVAGPLVDFRPRSAPEWLFIWENDYETLRDLVFEYVQTAVTRYRRTVRTWTVASGLPVNTNFKISFEQIMDLTRMCVLLVRKLHPTAKIQLEIAQPWGEYHSTNRRSIPPHLYAEAVVQAGISIDALGLRLQMGHAEPGCSTRDLLAISAMLDRYAAIEKPIAVTAMGAPSSPITPKPYMPRAGAEAEDPYEPGFWRSAWSEARQADWLQQVLAICCSKPYVQSVCWQDLCDTNPPDRAPEMPGGGLLNAGDAPKASMLRLIQCRNAMREGRSPLHPSVK